MSNPRVVKRQPGSSRNARRNRERRKLKTLYANAVTELAVSNRRLGLARKKIIELGGDGSYGN